MDLNIKGNSGSNNRFEENLTEKVEALYPDATKVVNDRSVTIQINISLHIDLNGEQAIRLFKTFQRRFHLIFEKRQSGHFDGESRIGTSVCQFSGSPSAIAAALRCIGEVWGDDAAEWEDGLSLVSEEELLNHPKTRQHMNALIPKELSESERQAMKEFLWERMSVNRISPGYIDRVLQSDPTLVEEITCDRQAWLILLPVLQGDGATDRDILQIHLWMFIVFNAMDFNKVLQTQFIPSFHGHNSYDGMRVVLRHKAFKALLRRYSPDVCRLLKSEYIDLNVGLEAIYRSSVMALHRYADDLAQLYNGYQKGDTRPDFAQYNRLNDEISEATQMLY